MFEHQRPCKQSSTCVAEQVDAGADMACVTSAEQALAIHVLILAQRTAGTMLAACNHSPGIVLTLMKVVTVPSNVVL